MKRNLEHYTTSIEGAAVSVHVLENLVTVLVDGRQLERFDRPAVTPAPDPLEHVNAGGEMELCGAVVSIGQLAAVCNREPHPRSWWHLAIDDRGQVVRRWRS